MDVSDDLSIPNSGFRGSRAGRYGTGRIRQGMDPDTRRLVLFAGALGVVLAGLIGASSLLGRRSGEVPVVTADSRPIREKPANPGGMKIEGAENDVFSAGSDTTNARLAPASESPNAKALQIPDEPSPPAVAASTPVTTEPPSVASAPAAASAAEPPVPAAAKPIPAKPLVAGSPPAAPKPAVAKPLAVAAEAHAAPSGHQTMVQLAALASEEAARTEWAQLTKKMPDLLNGRQPNYSQTERDGHTFWRVRTSGFADVSQARGFCDRVRAKGAGCSVADF
jgi:cell division septation protein DedD